MTSLLRFDTKFDAFKICEKAEDCGGISQNLDGTWECRTSKFVPENGSVSFAKPQDWHSDLHM